MSQEQIREKRTELHCIIYAMEIFEKYKKSYMTPKEFDKVLAKMKLDKEEEIYKLKNKL